MLRVDQIVIFARAQTGFETIDVQPERGGGRDIEVRSEVSAIDKHCVSKLPKFALLVSALGSHRGWLSVIVKAQRKMTINPSDLGAIFFHQLFHVGMMTDAVRALEISVLDEYDFSIFVAANVIA